LKCVKIALNVRNIVKGLTKFTVHIAEREMIDGTIDVVRQIISISEVVYDLTQQNNDNNTTSQE
jgi:hypothetical protein